MLRRISTCKQIEDAATAAATAAEQQEVPDPAEDGEPPAIVIQTNPLITIQTAEGADMTAGSPAAGQEVSGGE